MSNNRIIVLFILFMCSCLTGYYAQEVIPASGGEATGSGGSVSYSVGQLVYTMNNGTSGSIGQGVQQPYEISVVTGIGAAEHINLISAYPNPATDYLNLKIDKDSFLGLSCHLYDSNGKLIESNNITTSETSIQLAGLAPACYFLKIIQDKNEIKTFKIIKK